MIQTQPELHIPWASVTDPCGGYTTQARNEAQFHVFLKSLKKGIPLSDRSEATGI